MDDVTISVTGLSKRFARICAIEDVSFGVARGTVAALLGGNGAGKTTTLSILLGLLLPSSGQVKVLGENMLRHRYRVLHRMNFSSPYVDLPQRLTVAENLRVYARLYAVKPLQVRIQELAEALQLGAFLNRPHATLSAGQRTRVALAKALLNRPEVLLLDEPTASLDPDSADRIRGYLLEYQRASGATLLLASHNMHEVERMCGQVLILKRGRLVDEGAPAALIERHGRNNLEQVFLDIARNPGDGSEGARR
jgi:ABC-2 type transport system ATP-binding protein